MLADLRYAVRALRKTPAFTGSAILILSIGIGANTAVFSALNTLLFRPLPFGDAERLAMVGDVDLRSGVRQGTTVAVWEQLTRRTHSFIELAAVEPGLTLQGDGGRYLTAARVSARFFAVVRVAPIIGRAFAAEDTTPAAADVAMVSEELWKGLAARSHGRGPRTLTLGGRSHPIIGVVPAGFRLGFAAHDVWLPLRVTAAPPTADRSWRIIGRLRPGVSLDEARTELRVLATTLGREDPAHRNGVGIWMQSMRQVSMGERGPLAGILVAIVGLVLLIACFNIGTLQLARTSARTRELAIRAALGARSRDLARLALAEGVILAGAGAGGGLLLTYGIRQAAIGSIPELADLVIDLRVLAFTSALAGLSGLLVAVAPAMTAGRLRLSEALKPGGATGGHSTAGRQHAFVIVQTASAIALLVASGVLVSALTRLTSMKPGFRTDHILAVELRLPAPLLATPDQRRHTSDRVVADLQALPGVRDVSAASSLPFFGVVTERVQVDGRPASDVRVCGVRTVTPAYFEVFRIGMLAGRSFTAADRADTPPVAIVNQRMARLNWPDGNAIGARLRVGDEVVTVIGVAADVRSVGLRQPVIAEVYRPWQQTPPASMSLALLTSGDALAVLPAVRAAVNALHADAAISYANSMIALLEEQVTLVRWLTLFAAVFAGVALALAGIGLYGVIAFLVARRTPEIGVRMALGADRARIMRLVFASALRTIAAGVAAGTIAGIGLAGLLRVILLDAASPRAGVLAGIALIIALTDLLAVWLPARRAARVDPLVALRQD